MLRWNIDRNKAGPRTMMSVMWALRNYDVVADMPKATTRVTAIFGSKSALRPRAQIFADNIPGCRLAVAEDCGHFPMLDDPASLTALICDALGA
jgi:pimeloyl-ACP methyl ester carboxylesterase